MVSPSPDVFLSTPSSQRATVAAVVNQLRTQRFLSTPSSQRATAEQHPAVLALPISIHALFAEGDVMQMAIMLTITISIHALFAEGDGGSNTRPAPQTDFYPRPLRRGRPATGEVIDDDFVISIHALFAEGDGAFLELGCLQKISIHALFAEGDRAPRCRPAVSSQYFYPRPLRRGRRSCRCNAPIKMEISIHALFAEGDRPAAGTAAGKLPFLSTPSSQRATKKVEYVFF
mgnify:CR=1 FL=1